MLVFRFCYQYIGAQFPQLMERRFSKLRLESLERRLMAHLQFLAAWVKESLFAVTEHTAFYAPALGSRETNLTRGSTLPGPSRFVSTRYDDFTTRTDNLTTRADNPRLVSITSRLVPITSRLVPITSRLVPCTTDKWRVMDSLYDNWKLPRGYPTTHRKKKPDNHQTFKCP